VLLSLCAGTAAVNVGGSTLHSFTGIVDRIKPKVNLAEGLWKWAKFKESFRQTDALLVDEVSMVDCELLEKVSRFSLL
jgi:ATP-dependent DNA helicase PIF1